VCCQESIILKESLINKTNSAIKYTFIFKTLSMGLGGVASILIVRALSEFDYGVYNLLYSVIGLTGMIASLGIGNTLQRFIPEYYQKGEFRIAHNLYRATSLLQLMTNIVILGLTLIFWQNIAPLIKLTDYKHYFMLFTLVVFLHKQRNMLEICLASYFLHKYSKAIGCIFSLIRVLGYGIIILLEKDLWFAIITDLLAYLIVFATLQILYIYQIPFSMGNLDRFSRDEKKRISKYAVFYNFNDTGSGLLSANFDNFIIAMFLNPVAVGAYSFCRSLTFLIQSLLPCSYFMEVIRPAFFSAGTSSNNQKFTSFFQNIIKIDLLFSIPCFFFLVIYSHDIIMIIFNGKFITYSAVLSVLFFSSVVNSFAFPVELIAQLKEKANLFLYSKIFAVYNFIAAIFLIKLFGIWGAVFATETAILGKNLFIWYFIKEHASFKGLERFLLKIFSFWALISTLTYCINMFVIHTLLELLLGILIFAAAFFVQFYCNYFDNNEKKLFGKVANNNSKLLFIFKTFKMLPDQHTN
jgi:O-antigen/teichoic acid export membrane protein